MVEGCAPPLSVMAAMPARAVGDYLNMATSATVRKVLAKANKDGACGACVHVPPYVPALFLPCA